MRAMSEFEHEYQEQGVVFVAVNSFEPPERGRAFVDQTDLDYVWWWADRPTCAKLGVQILPTQIVLDRQGKVAWTSSMATLREGAPAIRRVLDEVLAGGAPGEGS
jgi:hypothetical protein